MNQASDRARGSSSARTWNRNSGFVSGARGFDALLVGIYEGKDLIFVAKVKNEFVPRIRDELFPALKAFRLPSARSRIRPRRGHRGGASR